MPDAVATSLASASSGNRLTPLAHPSGLRQPLARHDLCWLHAWPKSSLSILTVDMRRPQNIDETESVLALVCRWIEKNRPLIATRQPVELEEKSRRRLGLCFPIGETPRRVAFEASAHQIKSGARPLNLAEAIDASPVHWHAPLHAIDRAFARFKMTACVFGSLAWQAITGMNYLHERSDVDLVIDASRNAGQAILTQDGRLTDDFGPLTAALDAAPFRCDCELRLGYDAACSLAELRGNAKHVLIKHNDRSQLIARRDLRELAS